MKTISILGSTGSIGTQTLEVVRQTGDFRVSALTAGSNIDLLEKQMREFLPVLVGVMDPDKAEQLRQRTSDLNITVLSGMEGLLAAASEPSADMVVTAVVGMGDEEAKKGRSVAGFCINIVMLMVYISLYVSGIV